MLIGGIVLGLVLGLAAGGTLGNLATIRLRSTWLLVVAVVVRYGTEALLGAHVTPVEMLRLPLLASAFGFLLVALWTNRSYPGLSLAFVGILSNATVIVVNGGYMPIWEPSLLAAGFQPGDVATAIHTVLPANLDASFLLHLGPFADVIPIPLPLVQNVGSVGDAFLAAGLAFFLFAGVVRIPQELTEQQLDAIRRRLAGLTGSLHPGVAYELGGPLETGLTPAIAESAALERPLLLGGAGQRLASPATGVFAPDSRWTLQPAIDAPAQAVMRTAPVERTVALPIPGLPAEAVERVRQHPYVRLALNSSFSALWAGQLISLFGDRLHQLALVAVVMISTGSALATGLVFFAATLPNLLLSPIAGTFVDRWDHKEVLIVSDILRAAIVLLIPLAALVNVVLVYPMVFAVTTISIFFRPARVAILPRIVDERDLLTANSALWVGETLADVFGYPLAGIFVVVLGNAVPLAFWVDSATYLASATLLTAIAVHAITPAEVDERADRAEAGLGFVGELKAGWQFLRSEATLLANTIQAAIGQFTVGIVIALTPAYALGVFGSGQVGWQAVYGFLETGIGVGNLLGGFVIGLIGSRFGKGRMVIAGYAAWGFLVLLLALTDNLGVAIGVALGQGVANMVFVIPSQTLFQERTPPALMGRVVGFRFALVFGSMTVAMGVGAIAGEVLGVTAVLAFFGIVTMITGLAGLFVPAIRDA